MPQVVPFMAGALGLGAGTAGVALGGAAFGSWAAGAAFGSGILGKAVIQLAASVALSALSRALAPKQAPAGMRAEKTLNGGVNPEAFILGGFATGGAFVAAPMSHGTVGKMPNAFLTYVIELGGIPGQQMEGLILSGERAEILPDDPHPDYGQRIGGRFLGRAWIRYHDGSQTAADAMLLAKYPAPHVRPWASDMVGSGICYAVLTFQYDREVFQSWPECRFEMSGIPVYDPRQDSTVPGGSGPQRWDQPETWATSRNNAVLVYNILRGIRLPSGDVWGGGIPAEDLPLASWMAAMDRCDELVDDGAGGLEPQFRGGVEVMVDDDPFAVAAELLKGSTAALTENGGIWTIRVGSPGLPVMHITDADLMSDAPDDFKPFPDIGQIYNAIEATWPDPESLWESRDADPIYNPVWEAADGQRRLTASVSLPSTPYPVQVVRVMHTMIADHRRMRVHVVPLPPEAMVLEPLDTITWTSAANYYEAKLFEVLRSERDLRTGRVLATVREVDPDDYTPPTGLTRPAPPDLRPLLPAVQAVPGWSVAGTVIADDDGAPRRPALRLSWDADGADDARGIRWQIRLASAPDDVTEGPLHDLRPGEAVVSDGILPATVYQARARLVVDRQTEWSDWISAITPDARIGAADLTDALGQLINDAHDAAEAAADEARDALQAAQSIQNSVAQDTAAAILAAEAARDAALESVTWAELHQIAAGAARDDAQDAASASSSSASTADARATDAGLSAIAANAARLEAELERNAAQIARNESVQARSDSEGYALAALSSMEMAARLSVQGGGVLESRFLEEGKYGFHSTQWQAATWAPDAHYGVGRQATWSLNGSTQGGWELRSTSAGWVGQSNADAYVVEFDVVLNSGSVGGAGVVFRWMGGAAGETIYQHAVRLSDMVSGPVVPGQRMVARAVFIKPASFAGNFSRNAVLIRANDTANGLGPLAAKSITISRLDIRVASAEERGGGAIEATISQKYATIVDTNTAISQSITSYNASYPGGLVASVTSQQTAIANLNSYTAAVAALTAELSNGKIAGIRATVHNGAGGSTSGSLLEMLGDHVIAAGTLSVSRLIISDLTNYVTNSTLGDAQGWTLDAQVSLGNATASMRSGRAFAFVVPSANRYARWQQIIVEPGVQYLVSCEAQASAGATRRFTVRVYWEWHNASGAVVGGNGHSFPVLTTTTPQNLSHVITAPAGAVRLQISFGRAAASGEANPGYIGSPSVRRRTGSVLIEDGAVTADKVNTGSFNAAGLAIFGGSLQSANFSAGTSGWRIQSNGNAEWNNLIVRGSLVVGSVSDIEQGNLPNEYVWGGGITQRLSITLGAIDVSDLWSVHLACSVRGYLIVVGKGGETGPNWIRARLERRLQVGGTYGSWVVVAQHDSSVSTTWQPVGLSDSLAGDYTNAQYRLVTEGGGHSPAAPGSNSSFRKIALIARKVTR